MPIYWIKKRLKIKITGEGLLLLSIPIDQIKVDFEFLKESSEGNG